jgi:ATP-binding cassette subfamily F protein 3
VILITHDRSLMELVADRLWLAADGSIKPFDGDMDDYAKFVIDRARVAARAPTQVKREAVVEAPPPPPAPRPAAGMAGPLKRRLEAAEAVVARTTKALEEIDAVLADPAIYVKDPRKAADLGQKRLKAQAAVDKAEAEWIDIAEQLAALETA